MEKNPIKIVIIGGGLTGLSTAFFLNKKKSSLPLTFHIYEKCDRPGGLCRTEEEKGYWFDYTGHLLHFTTKDFSTLLIDLLGHELIEHQRRAWIFSKGVYTKYPFQSNLYGLPKDVVTECLYGYCMAHLESKHQNIGSFFDWILANFGRGIAGHFMVPYNQKLWRRHPSEITCDWIERFVPKPDLYRVIRGAISSSDDALGYNSYFLYPKKGGIESLIKSLSAGLNNIHVCKEVNRISLNPRMVYTNQGDTYPFDILVSTMPVNELVNAIDNTPSSVIQAARKLKYISVLNINFGIKKKIDKKHWVYVPEDHLIFYRIGFPSNFSPRMAPPGHSSIYAEISYDQKKGIDHEKAKEKVVTDLIAMGVIKGNSEIAAEKVLDIPFAYAVYDGQRKKSLSEVSRFLKKCAIFSAGRYGAWKYSSMEDAVLDGRKIAAVLANISMKESKLNLKETKIGGIV